MQIFHLQLLDRISLFCNPCSYIKKKPMLYICLVCLSSFRVFHRIYLYMKLCRRNNSVQVCQCLFRHLQQVSTTAVIFSYPQADSLCGQRQVCESVTPPLLRILRHEAVIGTISRKLVSLLMLCSNWFSVCGLVFMPRD